MSLLWAADMLPAVQAPENGEATCVQGETDRGRQGGTDRGDRAMKARTCCVKGGNPSDWTSAETVE